jgi:hypothetical protein
MNKRKARFPWGKRANVNGDKNEEKSSTQGLMDKRDETSAFLGPLGLESFAFFALAFDFAGTADGFGLFARAALRRLFVIAAQLHFAENAFALKLLLEDAQRLIHIVVTH